MLNRLFHPAKRVSEDDSQTESLQSDEKWTSLKLARKPIAARLIDEIKKRNYIVLGPYTKLRSISSFLFRAKERQFFRILSLQDGLLDEIYHYLPLVDKVCLSLSCQKLFRLFGTITKHEEMIFPRLLRLRIPILCVNSKDVPRNQLLLRLENYDWLYCSQCLKLHPRREFSKDSLKTTALERSCADYAGIFDLCPCYSWTIRMRQNIIDRLEQISTDTPPSDQTPMLSHRCSFSIGPGYNVQTSTLIYISVRGLSVNTRYTMCLPSPDTHIIPDPVFACPHIDLSSLNITEKYFNLCRGCSCLITKEATGVFRVVRYLGGSKTPIDDQWLRQCRLTGFAFSQNKKYW